MTKRIPPYSPEVRARAVRMVFDHPGEHASQAAAISSIAAKIGCAPETLRHWVRQAERADRAAEFRVQGLDGVGRVQQPAHLSGEGIERHHLAPGASPTRGNGRVFAAP